MGVIRKGIGIEFDLSGSIYRSLFMILGTSPMSAARKARAAENIKMNMEANGHS